MHKKYDPTISRTQEKQKRKKANFFSFSLGCSLPVKVGWPGETLIPLEVGREVFALKTPDKTHCQAKQNIIWGIGFYFGRIGAVSRKNKNSYPFLPPQIR